MSATVLEARVVESYAAGRKVGFTILVTDLPDEVQGAIDSGRMRFSLLREPRGGWVITLSPSEGKGLYSAAEVSLGGRGTNPPSGDNGGS